jgi:chaperonin GroES
MNVNTLQDRVLVKPVKSDTVSQGGIIIAGAAGVAKSFEAVVLGVGPGKRDAKGQFVPLDVQINDKILYDGQTGIPVTIAGEKLLVLKETEVLAVVE